MNLQKILTLDSNFDGVKWSKVKWSEWEFNLKLNSIIPKEFWVENNNTDYYLEKYPNLKKIDLVEETPINKMSNVAEVHMAEGSTTISSKKENILATFWAWPCIIIWGYSEWKAGLMHISAMNKIKAKYNEPFKEKAEQNKILLNQLLFFIWDNEDKDFKIIISWWNYNNEQKEEILNHIQNIIWHNIKNKYEILIGNSTSLAIDSKTGKFYKYDPMKNPNKKEINQFSAMSPQINFIKYQYK